MKNKELTLKQLEQSVLKHEEIIKSKPKYKKIDEFFHVEFLKKEYMNII